MRVKISICRGGALCSATLEKWAVFAIFVQGIFKHLCVRLFDDYSWRGHTQPDGWRLGERKEVRDRQVRATVQFTFHTVQIPIRYGMSQYMI